MMAPTDYTLFPVLKVLKQRKALLLKFTLAALLLSLAAYFIFPPKYKAELTFILKNPTYADRGNLYSDAPKDNYFASEEDITRFISIAESDSLKEQVIRTFKLDNAKEPGRQKRLQLQLLKFSKAMRLYRAENNAIILTYADKDAKRAAAIANFYVPLVEQVYRGFYNQVRDNVYGALATKVKEQDSAILALTDSLVMLREQYGIYDIISPSRNNVILGSMKQNGKKDYARGLEVIQNTESVKDELVVARAHIISLMNQYSTGKSLQNISLVTVTGKALPPVERAGPGLPGILLIGAFSGFFFSALFLLSAAYYTRR